MAKNPLYTSQRNDQRSGDLAPTMAHMGLLTHEGIEAIPPGAHLFFISDPRRADGITEVILEKVVFENHVLKEVRCVAYTRNEKSTRRLRLTANWEGTYESSIAKDVKP